MMKHLPNKDGDSTLFKFKAFSGQQGVSVGKGTDCQVPFFSPCTNANQDHTNMPLHTQ